MTTRAPVESIVTQPRRWFAAGSFMVVCDTGTRQVRRNQSTLNAPPRPQFSEARQIVCSLDARYRDACWVARAAVTPEGENFL